MNQIMQNRENLEKVSSVRQREKMDWQSWFLVWKFHKIQLAKDVLSNNKGLGIVEIALIIVVIVALAFLFKEKITNLLNDILNNVDAKGLGDKIPNH